MKPTKNEEGVYQIVPSFHDSNIQNLESNHDKAIKIKELSESKKPLHIIEEYLKKFSAKTVFTLCMMDSTGTSLSSLEWPRQDWQTYMEVFWYDV